MAEDWTMKIKVASSNPAGSLALSICQVPGSQKCTQPKDFLSMKAVLDLGENILYIFHLFGLVLTLFVANICCLDSTWMGEIFDPLK